jgi:hypothetical protein
MPITLTEDQLRFLRLRAQRLTPRQHSEVVGVAQVVKEVCGIQAQETPSAALALRVRSAGLVMSDIERAYVHDRTIIRTWGPRGTLHLLASDDIGWLLPQLGPVFVAGDRRRREQLGLSEEICVRGMRIMLDALANEGPLTRAQLIEQLATNGIQLEGQARPHLLARAALEGLICFGPDRGSEPTYVLLKDWIGQEHTRQVLTEDEAYTELTRRYLGAYGPATPEDQATWSGLSLSKTRAAWQDNEDELLEVETTSSPVWMLKTQVERLDELHASTPIVRLLPRFDIYLLGYQKRDLAVPFLYAKRVNAGGGIVHPTVLVDGRVVGTWKSRREKKQEVVMVEPFEQLEVGIEVELEAEVEDIARFLGESMRLEVILQQGERRV